MRTNEKLNFGHFLERFPVIDLPITLTEDSAIAFSRENKPLNSHLIDAFILPIEEDADDGMTEYVACLRIPETHNFHAVIYWKAALMDYQYILATFNKNGELISKRVIAGTYSDGDMLIQSVATIEEDWIIYVVTGKTTTDATSYDATSSKSFELELLPTGEIIRVDEQ